MRILQIRFKNLNSLAGEWEVDLTQPEYVSDGIFAITGPTGAGKSTILDAICLALYGRTPRLNKVTKGGNEIMSRQTGECFAEVTFETQAGRFRCHWSQHRARRKSDGELQSPKHEIANADTGEIFESKMRGVAEQIEQATGMDFDRFTRSMLLAQGGFAAFLEAAPDERAPILEQITGTEIYSQISIRVHERTREEKDKLNMLQSETTGIEILEPEQEIEIEQTLNAKQIEETELAAKSVDTAKAIAWLTNIDALKKDIVNLADAASSLQKDIDAFKPERDKLNRALSAATLDGLYATLTATRKQQADDTAALKTEQEALPQLETSAKEQAEVLKSAEQQTVHAKEALKAAKPILQQVRSLDQKLADQKKAVSEGDEACSKDAVKIDADKQARLKEQEKRSTAYETLGFVDAYLKAHAKDEWLIGDLAGIEEQLTSLLTRRHEVLEKETDQDKATKALHQMAKSVDDYVLQSSIRKQALDGASKQLQQGKAVLGELLQGSLLREYRTEKETLLREMALLSKIAELEAHRAKLEDGKPCPLCGAIEHPFAQGNVPVPDEIEQKIDALTRLISKAEEQEAAIEKLLNAESEARNKLTEAEKLESAAANDKKVAETALVEVTNSLEKLRTDFAARKQAVSEKLLPLGIAVTPDTEITSLLEALKARLHAWQEQVKKKAVIEKQIADIDSDLKRLNAVIETQSSALAEKRERLEILKKALATGMDERNALYGDKDPDEEERRLNLAVSSAETAERQARDLHNQLQQKWTTAKSHVESLNNRIDQREPDLRRLENDFAAALVPVGFSNEEQFLAARLPSEGRAELTAKARALDERQTDLKARQKDREARLATELALKVTEQSLEELGLQSQQCDESLKALCDTIAGLKHRLAENAAAKERIKAKQTAIDAQKKECRRWENLHELIGSSDGKKYRNFAQGLTFEIMVSQANHQLQKMTDRYLLAMDRSHPLELNVIDNYQAGEERSTKNLSGGESFIVSLSLALGLSSMASHKVRVDSLFLDEGFGTLDEEALEVALDTLAGLQHEGKLIGVISHVSALKERISTQIELVPQTGGRSFIQGPGCARVS
ncbi:MAG: AAA family ATPase [Methylophaga sp.]|uniref:AAA family ATPase n=1 Tax=Methylophaga sp. TaxID=2024840 RepID=UPI00299D89AE|nr:AAA family ATPase [Methylophaga sp.]MDX1749045.1 AAA family ATPase [Methylophaga sp.]